MIVVLQILLVVAILAAALMLAQRERSRNPPGPLADPEPTVKPIEVVALNIGKYVAEEFSSSQFVEFFGHKTLAAGHTVEKAVATWYALGYFCMMIGVGTAKGVGDSEGEVLLNSGLKGLLATWKMPPEVFSEFTNFNQEKIASILTTFRSIDNAQKFSRFFRLFTSEIRAGDIFFSTDEVSEVAAVGLLRRQILEDSFDLHSALGKMFLKIQQDIHTYINEILGKSEALQRESR